MSGTQLKYTGANIISIAHVKKHKLLYESSNLENEKPDA